MTKDEYCGFILGHLFHLSYCKGSEAYAVGAIVSMSKDLLKVVFKEIMSTFAL